MVAAGALRPADDRLVLHSPASPLCPRFIVLKALDLITIAVPPALPACLTVATTIAIARLAKHSIFVSSPSAITAAGHLNVICFDKTGTLTEVGAMGLPCPRTVCCRPASVGLARRDCLRLSCVGVGQGSTYRAVRHFARTQPGLALKGIVPAEAGAGGQGTKFGSLLEEGHIPGGACGILTFVLDAAHALLETVQVPNGAGIACPRLPATRRELCGDAGHVPRAGAAGAGACGGPA